MRKSDCFIMQGASIKDPMTLYYITEMNKDKIRALSICINDNMVQGLEDDSEYDNEIPKEAITLPSGTYEKAKSSMRLFLEDVKTFLNNHVIKEVFQIKIGGHYYDGYIHTITDIDEERVKYKLFRLEEENISPSWTGDAPVDSIKNYCFPISEQTYNEVLKRYQSFVDSLRLVLYQAIK